MAALFSVVASTAPAAADRGSVSVGLLVPSSGPLADLGIDVADGFKYYLATHGDRLSGFRIDLHEADEGAAVETALAGAKDLIESQKSDVIVGIVNSDHAYALADTLVAAKVPTIVAVAGADGLTQQKVNPLIFRVTNSNSQATMPLGDFACAALKRKTAVTIAVDYSFGYESAGGFARTYSDDGCRIVQELYVPPGTSDFAPYVAKIDRNAALVFASFSGVDAPHFLQAFRDAGIKTPLVGHGALTDELLLRGEGANALGVITSLQYSSTLPSDANTSFRLNYEGLTHRPVSRYVEDGYVAAEALDSGLARLPAGPIRGDALASALRGVSFSAPRGRFRFDDRHAAVLDIYIRRVRQVGGRMRNSVVSFYPSVSQFWRYGPARYLQFKTYIDLKGSWARPPSIATPQATSSAAPSPDASH